MGRKYTRAESEAILLEELNNPDSLYKANCLNWKGTLKGVNETYTNYLSEFLINCTGTLNSIKMVTRKTDYSMHSGKEALINQNSNRDEENIGKIMYNNSFNESYEYNIIGKILDYQIPLKGKLAHKAGKIDIISYNKNTNELFLLELKRPDSEETMLRAVLEAFTYSKQVDIDKLIEDLKIPVEKKGNKPTVIVAPLVYKDRYAHMQYVSKYNEKLRVLMNKLNVKPYFIEEQSDNKGKVYDYNCKANDLAYIEKLLAKSNLSDGLGRKGSKYWMGMVLNTRMKDVLDGQMKDTVNWLSPLRDEKYKEYKLSDSGCLKKLETYIPNIKVVDENIWNKNGQLWDGIGISEDEKTLYLVEAKAHTKEVISACAAKGPEVGGNLENIKDSLKMTYDSMGSKGNFGLWTETYYQLANRLTYVKELNKKLNNKDNKVKKAKLLLINFTDDYTNKPTEENDFVNGFEKVQLDMFGDKQKLDKDPDVEIIYFSVIPQ